MWSKFGDYINILEQSKVIFRKKTSDENWETK
jgi:hypothetical protein